MTKQEYEKLADKIINNMTVILWQNNDNELIKKAAENTIEYVRNMRPGEKE